MRRSTFKRPTERIWTFLWHGWHGTDVYGKDRNEAERNARAKRPAYIPEDTKLTFYTFRDLPKHN